jgi:hypothetical protein
LLPRGVLLREGAWFYEVTVTSPGAACIGWATPAFRGDPAAARGVGDCDASWGFDGHVQVMPG